MVAATEPIEIIGIIGFPVKRCINLPNKVLLYSLSTRFLILRGLIDPTPMEMKDEPIKIVDAIIKNDCMF